MFGLGPEKPGYEENWTLGGLKLDVFAADEVEPGWWRTVLWVEVGGRGRREQKKDKYPN